MTISNPTEKTVPPWRAAVERLNKILGPFEKTKSGCRQPVDPTPDQIAEACAKIQASWSPNVKYWRARGKTHDNAEPDGGLAAPVYSELDLGIQNWNPEW